MRNKGGTVDPKARQINEEINKYINTAALVIRMALDNATLSRDYELNLTAKDLKEQILQRTRSTSTGLGWSH